MVMIKHSFLILLLVFICLTGHSQTKDSGEYRKGYMEKELGLLIGANVGHSGLLEIGLSKVAYGSDGHHPLGYGYFISNEVKLSGKFIMGPKIGVYFAGGSSAMGFGCDLIYYTDFDKGSLTLRPDIGFSVSKFRIAYGYNFKMTNKDFAGINRGVLHISYSIRLKKINRQQKSM
jgi:hypothetical protein